MTENISLQNVFYNIRSKGDNTASFPHPGRKAGSRTRVKVTFKDTEEFMFISVDEHVTVDFSDNPSDERFNDPTVVFKVDQSPREVLNQGIDTDKIDVEGLTNNKGRTSKILNALDYAFFYGLGRRGYATDLRIEQIN